jgi:hypothetical protein
MKDMNSERVRGSVSKVPRMALETVELRCFCTPRIIMQVWLASMTTATPWAPRCSIKGIGDLAGQSLLDLQAAGEDVDHAGDLAQPDHLAVGQIADMRMAEEGQHVVLAHRVELDIAHDHHLLDVFLEERPS